jgi:hypothetical protein
MVKDYWGTEIYWGDAPVGDFDLRYINKSGGLLIGEWKGSDSEIERDTAQRYKYLQMVRYFHPDIWLVYITGQRVPDGMGRWPAQCERFRRLMPDDKLKEIEIRDLMPRPGNVTFLTSYFDLQWGKEVFRKNVGIANNDNFPRFVPDYGKKMR